MTYAKRLRMRTRSCRSGSAASQNTQPDVQPLAPATYFKRHGDQRRSMQKLVSWRVGELVNLDSPIHQVTNSPIALHGEHIRRQRRRAGRRVRGGSGLLVDQLLQFFARLEVRNLLRRHVHLVAGLGVTALPRLAL